MIFGTKIRLGVVFFVERWSVSLQDLFFFFFVFFESSKACLS